MARLHEYEGKALLKGQGIGVPRGGPAATPQEAWRIAAELNTPVVIKIQAWTTGRAAMGGIAFAQNPGQAAEHAGRLLEMKVGAFPVESVLVEEKLDIAREFFVSLTIDDATRSPVILFAASGGTGIEERADDVIRIECDVNDGPDVKEIEAAVARVSRDGVEADGPEIDMLQRAGLIQALDNVFQLAKRIDARSVEINPLVITGDGRVMAADCRMTIDDYAVYRQPELGILIARELDHPPTALERAAYKIEQDDHRGTFYFVQLNTEAEKSGEGEEGTRHWALGTGEDEEHTNQRPKRKRGLERRTTDSNLPSAANDNAETARGLIGFHGAGGGGSMMSMDAIVNEGFTVANFCDTSGNPSAAKVYRAARIILSQPGLCGYFGSGSGVASQEQVWSAYGLAKAFWELQLNIPAVIRLGGNSEDRAVEILQSACTRLAGTVEAYRKDDSPAFIARRFAELVGASDAIWSPCRPRKPTYVGTGASITITGGTVWIDTASCDTAVTKKVVEFGNGLFKEENGVPVLAVTSDEAAGKDSEFIACEVELRSADCPVVFVELDMPAIDVVADSASLVEGN